MFMRQIILKRFREGKHVMILVTQHYCTLPNTHSSHIIQAEMHRNIIHPNMIDLGAMH